MLALPLQGVAAIDTSCARASSQAPAFVSSVSDSTQVGHAAHARMHKADGNEAAVKDTSDCSDAGTPHKLGNCTGGVCHIGATAPPLSIHLATSLERTEVAFAHPPVLFAGEIPAGLERPPRHFLG